MARVAVGPFRARHVGTLLATAVAVGVLFVAATSPFSGREGDVSVPAPAAGFYPLGEPATGLAMGDRPPPFSTSDEEPITDLDGRIVDLTDLRGRPVWVFFWTSWCPPCQAEMPDIQRAWMANAGSGIEIVAVNVQETLRIARDYADTYGLTFRIAVDPAATAFRNWAVFGLPTHYFIGRDGVIRDRWFGPLALGEMQRRIELIGGP